MKKLVLIAGVALVAACSEKQEAAAPEPAATEAAVPETATPTPGSYDVTLPDGSKRVTVLAADGTYQDKEGDKVVEKGAWAVKDGKTCFDPEGDAAEQCFTEGPRAADGSFDATDEKGAVTKVKPAV